ncbi:retrovirus-related Pol polyprotein from type-1 retrotransposable element R2 [Caerostris darwini]|uniref:Retrovirus-related Pol polyprotein from type-1 retrotransposable element R2 n=1 Tax=Caerostris darwini TaxID=1538125 RepID=A0AAV4TFS3_9ARAC|nr:retrovirus-related Pol polyprotein from type-1 retrotransposable element R2 [Caerostris darwini]
MPFDGVIEHNFLLQTAIEKARASKRNICTAWLDVSNAFGTLSRCLFLFLDGVKQGCLLFNITIDPVIREIQGSSASHQILAFADDICLITNFGELQVKLNETQHLLGRLRLTLNPGKSYSFHLHGSTPVGWLAQNFSWG